ncbi:MAG: hypothetical protein K9H25_16475 [Rhodospirillum sp.]|nr:hypothetical protein [Rhodospirillum sp.]MCF8490979.1 hypothetical protein [Rhodospirillum sp.]MCF8501192.1 hypothetical protein [Rhodospirillum sp.]
MRNGVLRQILVSFAVFALVLRVSAPITAAEASQYGEPSFCRALDWLSASSASDESGSDSHGDASGVDCAVCMALSMGTAGTPPLEPRIGGPAEGHAVLFSFSADARCAEPARAIRSRGPPLIVRPA